MMDHPDAAQRPAGPETPLEGAPAALPVRGPMGRLKHGNRPGNPWNAPRCGAKTRSGAPCRSAAMPNGRCRMHGGPARGPTTPEGLARSRTATLTHGPYSAAAVAKRRDATMLRRAMRTLESAIRRGLDPDLVRAMKASDDAE